MDTDLSYLQKNLSSAIDRKEYDQIVKYGHDMLEKGAQLNPSEWKFYRFALKKVGLRKRLYNDKTMWPLFKASLEDANLAQDFLDDHANKIKVRRFQIALELRDYDYLQTLCQEYQVNSIEEYKEIFVRLQRKRNMENWLLSRSQQPPHDFSMDDLIFARDNLSHGGQKVIERIIVKKSIKESLQSVASLILAQGGLDLGQLSRLLLQIWDSDSFGSKWQEFLNEYSEYRTRYFQKLLSSIVSDKGIIWLWRINKFTDLPDEQSAKIKSAQMKLGALTRLKWARKYSRGLHITRYTSNLLSDSDLLFED